MGNPFTKATAKRTVRSSDLLLSGLLLSDQLILLNQQQKQQNQCVTLPLTLLSVLCSFVTGLSLIFMRQQSFKIWPCTGDDQVYRCA